MNWDSEYRAVMLDIGIDPYACEAEGCTHVSRGMWGMIFHRKFGNHGSL